VRVFGDERFEFTEPAPQTIVLSAQRAAGRALTLKLRLQVIELRSQTVNHLLLVVRQRRSRQSKRPEGLLKETDDGYRATPVSVVNVLWREHH
jgi:hypothetical protein